MNSNHCTDCGSRFSTYGNLRKHVMCFHPLKVNVIAPPKRSCKAFKYKCANCGNNFSALKNLRYHMKKVHKIYLAQSHVTLKNCPLCNFTDSQNVNMINHYNVVHNITIDLENKEFASSDLFFKWKKNVEKTSDSEYVKNSGSKLSKCVRYMYYSCHRSGNFVTKGRGLRQLKTQGSNKINGFCPAGMSVTTTETGFCKVTFFKTHIGHDILNSTPNRIIAQLPNEMLTAFETPEPQKCEVISNVDAELNELLLKHRQLALKKRFSILVDSIINSAEFDKLEKSFQVFEIECNNKIGSFSKEG